MKTDIIDRAESLGLEIIETTKQGNGYPSNLRKAITGFEDFKAAEKFAEENGLRVEKFHKKAGWQLWVRSGDWTTESFYMPSVYDGDPNYQLYFCGDEENFTESVKEQIAELNDFALIQEFVEQKAQIWDEFGCLGEDEFILVKDGELDCVEDKYRMEYEYDSSYYVIGVI